MAFRFLHHENQNTVKRFGKKGGGGWEGEKDSSSKELFPHLKYKPFLGIEPFEKVLLVQVGGCSALRHDAYVSRIIRFTLLAPEIIHAVLAGKINKNISTETLKQSLPTLWEDQKKMFDIGGNFKSLQKCLKILAVIWKWSVFGGYSLSSHAQTTISISSAISFQPNFAGLLKLPLLKNYEMPEAFLRSCVYCRIIFFYHPVKIKKYDVWTC